MATTHTTRAVRWIHGYELGRRRGNSHVMGIVVLVVASVLTSEYAVFLTCAAAIAAAVVAGKVAFRVFDRIIPGGVR